MQIELVICLEACSFANFEISEKIFCVKQKTHVMYRMSHFHIVIVMAVICSEPIRIPFRETIRWFDYTESVGWSQILQSRYLCKGLPLNRICGLGIRLSYVTEKGEQD